MESVRLNNTLHQISPRIIHKYFNNVNTIKSYLSEGFWINPDALDKILYFSKGIKFDTIHIRNFKFDPTKLTWELFSYTPHNRIVFKSVEDETIKIEFFILDFLSLIHDEKLVLSFIF